MSYKIIHLNLSTAGDTSNIQEWLDANTSITIVAIQVDAYDVYITYTE